MSIVDARKDEIGTNLVAPICIIGAGAAGITLARSLASSRTEVLLVESGNLEFESATQALYSGRNIGLDYYDLLGCRLRFFGGTTNHWGGYCRANDPINYEGRPELGVPAWPFGIDEISPYLARAADSLDISPDFFKPFRLLAEAGIAADDFVDVNQSQFFTTVNQISQQRRLGDLFREELSGSPHIRVVTNLNAVDVGLGENARRVERVTCKTLTGKTLTLRASAFVLACHAIENARLLLVSNSVTTDGVGNDRGLVGRYFMEHPQIDLSVMMPGPEWRAFYDRSELTRSGFLPALSLSEMAMRREGVLSYHMHFKGDFASPGARRTARRFFDGIFAPFSPLLLSDARDMLAELDALAKDALKKSGIVNLPSRMKQMFLNHTIEQAPNASSRVVLSTERRDALGTPEADLDWRLSELDLHTFQVGQRLAVAELSALGFGRFAIEEFDWPLVRERVKGHYHHYGTTRMANDPAEGVVDARQKVHGVQNLYIGGSSVFPTSAAHGPTLHIIGLSLRLAETLKARLPRMEPPT